VLAVGIDDYRDSQLRLNFAVPDARSLTDALRKAAAGLYKHLEVTTRSWSPFLGMAVSTSTGAVPNLHEQ